MDLEAELPGSVCIIRNKCPERTLGLRSDHGADVNVFTSLEHQEPEAWFLISQDGLDQDKDWLSEEWDRCKQETVRPVGSDTLSSPDVGCIDDLIQDEEPDHEERDLDQRFEVETEHINVDHNYINELNYKQNANNIISFPYEQQDYLDRVNGQKQIICENVILTDPLKPLYKKECDSRENIDGMRISVIGEENSSHFAASNKYTDCLSINVIKHEDTEVHLILEESKEQFDLDKKKWNGNSKIYDIVSLNENKSKLDYLSYQNVKTNNNGKEYVKVITLSKDPENGKSKVFQDNEPSNTLMFSKKERKSYCEGYCGEKEIKDQTTQTCDVMFRDKEKLPSDMFICEYCQKVFTNQYKLVSHLHRSHNITENRSKANDSPGGDEEWPPNIQRLSRRINGKKVFFCSYCPYRVNRCDSITKHIFRMHRNGRPVPQFQCEVCGKMFVDRAYLRNHKVSHWTEKPHSCEVCGRTFHRQPSLKRHMQTHIADRQYSCMLCDYQSNRKHLMYKHVEHHKLGRAYICDICNAEFFTQLAYRSHMYTHHASDNSCSFCKVGFSSRERMMCHMKKVHFAYEIKVGKD